MESIRIMALGMGTVFIMLGLLVITTMVAHRIIAAYEGGAEMQPSDTTRDMTSEKQGKPIAAIIATAIAMFRRKRG